MQGWISSRVIFYFQQDKDELCCVNGVSLSYLADVCFGEGTTPDVVLFSKKKKIGEERVKRGNLLLWWSVKTLILLLRRFLVIVHMPQRYSTCVKLASSFKNDDRERKSNVKYRESEQIPQFVGGRNYLVYWMVEGLIFMSLQTLVSPITFFFDWALTSSCAYLTLQRVTFLTTITFFPRCRYFSTKRL